MAKITVEELLKIIKKLVSSNLFFQSISSNNRFLIYYKKTNFIKNSKKLPKKTRYFRDPPEPITINNCTEREGKVADH